MIFNLRLRSCFLAALGGLILAFGLYNIHALSSVTEGGVLGFCLLLEHHFCISPAISGLVLNAFCYFIGWRSLGRNFIGYSFFAAGAFSLFYAIFEKFPPLFPQIAEYPLLAAILGALFVGIGCGISVRAGGAPAGDDALAMSISKLTRTSIKWTYLVSDVTVLALSLTYIPIQKIFYSLITVILSGQLVDLMQKIKLPEREGNSDAERRDVLCGTMRNAEQLKTCLKKKFYHIPAHRLSPKDFPLRYIALYQSQYKFGKDSGILYYGEIEKCSLVKRCDISEIPRNSNERYYRFDIKEWKKLSSPIKPTAGDFINLTTTLPLLTMSQNTDELTFSESRELMLYRETERLLSGEISEVASQSGETALTIKDNHLCVCRNGRTSFTCAKDDYAARSLEIFRYIYKELE